MITLQSRQSDGSWAVRNAFTAQNKLVACGQMDRADLIALAEHTARQWHTRSHEALTLRVHDDSAAPAAEEYVCTDDVHFVVTADHVSPRWAFVNHPARARQDRHDKTWYAVSDGLGCSKNYRTPRDAVHSLFGDNACTHIRIY